MPAINKNFIIDEDNDIANITDGGLDIAISSAGSVASYSGDAILTTNYSDDYTFKGRRFICNGVEDIATGTSVYYLFNLSAVETDGSVFILPLRAKSSEEEIRIKLYEDTDYTGGTSECIKKVNRKGTYTPNLIITKGATGTTKGDLITEHAIFASSGFFGTTTSATGGSSAPLILDQTKNYLIEISNEGAGTTTVEHDFDIFEL